jgi:hypothetical protein
MLRRHGAQIASSTRGDGAAAASDGGLPPDGLSKGIDALAEVLRASLRADVCLMALSDRHSSEPRVYRTAAAP